MTRPVVPAAAATLILLLCGCAAGGSSEARVEESMPDPAKRLVVKVLNRFPHDPGAYTQGLVWHEGAVYESTGRHGSSSVRRVDLETGKVERIQELSDEYFGEGLERVGERFLQLTWKAGKAFVWDENLKSAGEPIRYRGQGWGLASDGEQLYTSDGTHVIRVRNPQTFEQLSRFEVKRNRFRLDNLNELEWVAGQLWANVYQTDEIVAIDPETGRVTATVDCKGLLSPTEAAGAEVLNGIAYRPETETFLITGKLWPWLFEVEFVEATP